MSVLVYCGPTIPAAAVLELVPSASVRPPAGCGDIYRACREESPVAIGLIDGYFDHRLSVWHKEILWALGQGVHVYGSASMGALRAAELWAFGMVGVGKIFDQLRTGELEDDDEVAVIHEERERGYAVQSVAMVNLRETLRQAVDAGVLETGTRDTLVARLKQLFYPQRTGQAFTRLVRSVSSEVERQPLMDWIEKRGIVDQKRLDAAEMLERMSDDLRSRSIQKHALGPPVPFEYTSAWHALTETVEREAREAAHSSASAAHHVAGQPMLSSPGSKALMTAAEGSALLDRVRSELKEVYAAILLEAVERAFALLLSEQEAAHIDPGIVQLESERFRQERELLTPEQTASWLARYGLDVSTFSALIHDNALSAQFADKVRQAALQQLPSVLRNRGVDF